MNGRNHKYGYNGKELQDDNIGGNQLDWLDFGARNHDPALGRFMNIDPLAEDYNFQSTYIMSLNNPVYLIDFNGEGVLTDYKLIKTGNDKGKVVRVDPNDGSENNKNDRLFATDENGKVKKNEYIKIDKTTSKQETVITELAKKKSHSHTGTAISYGFSKNMKEAFTVFKFVSENSNVEWSMAGILDPGGKTERYYLGTRFHETMGLSATGAGIFGRGIQLKANRLRFSVHSHPNTIGGSSGDMDKADAHRLKGGSIDLFYIYHIKSKKLVKYNNKKYNVFEKKINKPSDFYTGKYK